MLTNNFTIFFDLDGTLYSYDKGHSAGLLSSYQYWLEISGDSYDDFISKYLNARNRVKRFLEGTVASHSRVLYFQGMVEENLKTSFPFHIAELTQRYWDSFINNIEPFDGVVSTLAKLKKDGHKLAVITNMSAEIQFRKLHQLNLDNYFDAVITSEEAGQEKPHPHIYLHAIDRMNVKPTQCFMIGDDYVNDVEASQFVGLKGVLVTIEGEEKDPKEDGIQISHFSQLHGVIEKFAKDPLEGVIKYTLNHRESTVGVMKDRLSKLIVLRDELWSLNLIGVYPSNHHLTPNIGFGNASERFTENGQFIISGSQTGDLQFTNIEQYSLVLDYNISQNELRSKGLTKPSSESLTHAAIYEIAPEINFVIHVHHKDMWENYKKLGMPTTPKDIPYGTPEMATAIQDVFKENLVLSTPVCMLGHIEGLLTWGRTKEEALEIYKEALSKLDQSN